jgi:hypothetical protein
MRGEGGYHRAGVLSVAAAAVLFVAAPQVHAQSGSQVGDNSAQFNFSSYFDEASPSAASAGADADTAGVDNTAGLLMEEPSTNESSTNELSGFAQSAPPASTDSGWLHRWLSTVDEVRKEQPHYVAPLITTHVLLVQQFRYDSYWTPTGHGNGSYDFGAQKGLEIIPNSRMEVQVGVPPYIDHTSPGMPDGFGDVSIFLKFRAFSAPEEKGDYFVGFFLGGTFPSGTVPNGMGHTVWSPMLAAAKGWGTFDWQITLSANLPQSGTEILGRQIVFNNTVQYAIHKIWWPELESNTTFFVDGPHSGETQSFVTPGLLVGPFTVAERLRFEPGGGVQIAVTQFHQYAHRWIWTFRFPF